MTTVIKLHFCVVWRQRTDQPPKVAAVPKTHAESGDCPGKYLQWREAREEMREKER